MFSEVRTSHFARPARWPGISRRTLTLLTPAGRVVIPLLGLTFAAPDGRGRGRRRSRRAGPRERRFSPMSSRQTPTIWSALSRDPALARVYRDGLALPAWTRGWSRGAAASVCGPGGAAGRDGQRCDRNCLLATVCPTVRRRKITIIGPRASWLPGLAARYGLAPPYHYDPPMDFDRHPASLAGAVSFILDHPARLVFLAVGSPRQERSGGGPVAANRNRAPAPRCASAPASRFLAGAERRAPAWMRRYRLGMGLPGLAPPTPRRLARRYLVDSPRVLPLLLREKIARPMPDPPSPGGQPDAVLLRSHAPRTPDGRAL